MSQYYRRKGKHKKRAEYRRRQGASQALLLHQASDNHEEIDIENEESHDEVPTMTDMTMSYMYIVQLEDEIQSQWEENS